MFKKIISILLSITLLLTLCPVTGVFAASEVTNGTLTEDFDDMATTSDYVSYNSIFASHGFFTNVVNKTDAFNTEYPSYKIVKKSGADGKLSNMLEMRSPVTELESNYHTDTVGIGLPSYLLEDYNAGEKFTYSFDFCFEKVPADDSCFSHLTGAYAYLSMFYHNIHPGMYSNSGTYDLTDAFYLCNQPTKISDYRAKLTPGSWYRAEMSAGADNYLYYAIYDEEGTELYREGRNTLDKNNSTRTLSSSHFARLLGAVSLYPVKEEDAGFTVLIDNAEYKIYTSATAPELKTGSYFTNPTIMNNATGVATDIGKVTVAFDQLLADAPTATLTPSGGAPIECAMKKGDAYANSYFYTITLPGELEEGTNYTLSFENCKNSSAVSATDTIAFKTEGGVSEEASIEIVGEPGKNKDDVITFTCNAAEVGTAKFIVAFYDVNRNLVGVEIPEDVDVTNESIEITLTATYSDAKTMEIFAWDSFNTIKPLAKNGIHTY